MDEEKIKSKLIEIFTNALTEYFDSYNVARTIEEVLNCSECPYGTKNGDGRCDCLTRQVGGIHCREVLIKLVCEDLAKEES